MKTTKATPRTSAKKAGELVRQGKLLNNLLTVYERMNNGELTCEAEGKKAIQNSIIGKCTEIINTIAE